jgi:hypothetical protein
LEARLEPYNNALLYRAGIIDFDAVTYNDIAIVPFTSETISIDDLAADTVVYVQTTAGRLTKFKVLDPAYHLYMQWVTYE